MGFIRSRIIRWGLLAPLLAVLAACGADPLAIDQALKDNRLDATFVNTGGGSSGDVCVGTFKHAQGESFNLQIPTGTVLRNSDSSRESFVIVRLKGELESVSSKQYRERKSIVLSSGDEFIGGLECYSLDAMLGSPESGDTFSVDGVVSGDTKAVVEALENDDNLAGNQIAVWATTDDLTRDDLESVGYTATDSDIAAAKKIIEKAKLDPANFKIFQ
jgi:hypothetical protein